MIVCWKAEQGWKRRPKVLAVVNPRGRRIISWHCQKSRSCMRAKFSVIFLSRMRDLEVMLIRECIIDWVTLAIPYVATKRDAFALPLPRIFVSHDINTKNAFKYLSHPSGFLCNASFHILCLSAAILAGSSSASVIGSNLDCLHECIRINTAKFDGVDMESKRSCVTAFSA
jgi:hypothetical protein